MKKLPFIFFLLFFIIIMPCYGTPSVEPHDVRSMTVDSEGADALESFWDLPLYFQIITITAIILALGWKIVALLTAWAKKDPKNENRLNILNFIERNPGSTVNMIEKDLDLKRGTVRYHVNALKDSGKILLFRNGNYVSMFRNESDLWNKSHGQIIEPHLQGVMCKKVCKLIFENPGITNMELSERLGISKGTVRSHIRTLEDMDCLAVETSGKFKNYYIREDYHPDTLPFFERVQ